MPKKFWGYLGTDGKHHVLRFHSISGMNDLWETGVIKKAISPFQAPTPKDAMRIVKRIK